MKVLLIANNQAAIVPATGFDLYVHFNIALHWGKTPASQSLIAVRKAGDVVKAGSFRCYPNTLSASRIVAIGWRRDVEAFFLKHPAERREIIDVAEAPCPPKQAPTSGWAAIHHYLNRKHQVSVCGFDLKAASYYLTTRLHNMDYEIRALAELVKDGKVERV